MLPFYPGVDTRSPVRVAVLKSAWESITNLIARKCIGRWRKPSSAQTRSVERNITIPAATSVYWIPYCGSDVSDSESLGVQAERSQFESKFHRGILMRYHSRAIFAPALGCRYHGSDYSWLSKEEDVRRRLTHRHGRKTLSTSPSPPLAGMPF
jgi:hypothetical protein